MSMSSSVTRKLTHQEIDHILSDDGFITINDHKIYMQYSTGLKKIAQKHLMQFKKTVRRQLLHEEVKPSTIEIIKSRIIESFVKALVDAGEAVGLLASQADGQPAMQMTMNTFKFAGTDTNMQNKLKGYLQLLYAYIRREGSYLRVHFNNRYMTYSEVQNMRTQFVGVIINNVLKRKPVINRIKKLGGVTEWHKAYLKFVDLKLPKCEWYMTLHLDPVAMYSYRITPSQIIEAIMKVDANQPLVCIPGRYDDYIIEMFPQASKIPDIPNYSGDESDANKEFMFLHQETGDITNVFIQGIRGIAYLKPKEVDLWSYLKFEEHLNEKKEVTIVTTTIPFRKNVVRHFFKTFKIRVIYARKYYGFVLDGNLTNLVEDVIDIAHSLKKITGYANVWTFRSKNDIDDNITAFLDKFNITDREIIGKKCTFTGDGDLIREVLKIFKYASFSVSKGKFWCVEIERNKTIIVSGQISWYDELIRSTGATVIDSSQSKMMLLCKSETSINDLIKEKLEDPESDTYRLNTYVYAECLGSNIAEVMVHPLVNARMITSSDPYIMYEVFGINAYRNSLISELIDHLTASGIYIDPRHVVLSCNIMTTTGVPRGFNFQGIKNTNDINIDIGDEASEKTIEKVGDDPDIETIGNNKVNGPMSMAIIQSAPKNLISGCINGGRDDTRDLTPSLILGQRSTIGTGYVTLIDMDSVRKRKIQEDLVMLHGTTELEEVDFQYDMQNDKELSFDHFTSDIIDADIADNVDDIMGILDHLND